MHHTVNISHDLTDIATINRRSIEARDGIRIIELSNLGDIIPFDIAEAIRKELLHHKTPVKQLTNRQVFSSWTHVKGFVGDCMEVRYVPEAEMAIKMEIIIFNDTVALYKTDPEVSVIVIEDANFATQQKALFDTMWSACPQLNLADNGSTT